tara:strand:- start:273 stop:1226 length:954 start_codon:yes stop_codon:yes gene_type:complete
VAQTYVSFRTSLFPGGDPISGVYVALYNEDGTAFQTSATSNADGTVFLGDLAEASYELRITAPAPAKVQKGTIQKITVQGAGDQAFDVVIDTSSLPESGKADVCRCSGVFVDPYGDPVRDVSLHFSENLIPTLMYAAADNTTRAVVPKKLLTKTDASGFASVDLIQDASYNVYMEGFENVSRTIKVPKLTASSLPDVLFPVVDRVEYELSNVILNPANAPTITVNVGTETALDTYTVFRSGVREKGLNDVIFDQTNTDKDIVSVSLTDGGILLEALAVGSTSIEVTRIAASTGTGITIYPSTEARGTLHVTVQEIPA